MSDAGVHNYQRDFKGLFTAAQVYYNKPSLGIESLPYNPFKEYKLAQLPEKRKRNLTVEQMLKIKNLQLKPNSRTEFPRSLHVVFLLVWHECGRSLQLWFQNYFGRLSVCYGDVDHLIPGQTDHQLADVGRAANAIKKCTKIVI